MSNIYVSDCCKQPAEKKPCIRTPEDKKERKFSQSTLGKWRCSICKRRCKVTVTAS